LKFIRTKTRRFWTLYLNRGILLHQRRTELHLPATNLMIHSADLLSAILNLHSLFQTDR
jgi:hypothetical protein